MTGDTEEPSENDVEDEEAVIPADVEVEKDTSKEDGVPVRYNVASYGWDSDVEGLVKRLDRKDIVIPKFQRNYVWNRTEKSRFIESLILGLPIPSIFLSTDPQTKKMNIIDGQQRLLSLQQYLRGEFSLYAKDLQPELKGLYFSTDENQKKRKALTPEDRRTLENSLLHAVVIKQETPDSSDEAIVQFSDAIIQIFKRLNTSGKALQAQEVRACVYYGAFNDMLGELNQHPTWRTLFGREHTRLKDMEAILRYYSLLTGWEEYKSPMPGFLDHWMQRKRFIQDDERHSFSRLFSDVIEVINSSLGEQVFRTSGTFLLSKFDAVMVGLSSRLLSNKPIGPQEAQEKFETLLSNKDYKWAVEEFVNDTDRVKTRIKTAIEIFG